MGIGQGPGGTRVCIRGVTRGPSSSESFSFLVEKGVVLPEHRPCTRRPRDSVLLLQKGVPVGIRNRPHSRLTRAPCSSPILPWNRRSPRPFSRTHFSTCVLLQGRETDDSRGQGLHSRESGPRGDFRTRPVYGWCVGLRWTESRPRHVTGHHTHSVADIGREGYLDKETALIPMGLVTSLLYTNRHLLSPVSRIHRK